MLRNCAEVLALLWQMSVVFGLRYREVFLYIISLHAFLIQVRGHDLLLSTYNFQGKLEMTKQTKSNDRSSARVKLVRLHSTITYIVPVS